MAKETTGAKKEAVRAIARNRKARHDYFVEETFEAGLVLLGTEVKSCRAAKVSLGEGWVELRGHEAWLVGVHINEFPQAHQFNHEPLRPRKLLLHQRELARLSKRVEERGYTCIPLEMYFKGAHIKVVIALVKGKRDYDRREDKKKQESDREIARALRRGRDG